jgi:WD40 repeat protein
VWDLEAGKETLSLRGHTHWVTGLALSADGKRLYSASSDTTIKVWDLDAGKETLTLRGHTDGVSSLALSADGKQLYSASHDKTIKVWDLDSGKEILILRGHTGEVSSLALSADGKRLYSGGGYQDGTIKVWDLNSGKETLSLRGHTDANALRIAGDYADGVSSLALSGDGKWLYSGRYDNTIKVWDLDAGKETLTLPGVMDWSDWVNGLVHGERSVPVISDGKRLYSGSWDRTIKAWDLDAGKEALTLRGHVGPVTSLVLSSDGKRLFSASYDRTIKVWNLKPEK